MQASRKTADAAPIAATSQPSGRPFLRQLLAARQEWIEERLYAMAEASGYKQVTPAMSRLFGLMKRQPVGISVLARQLAISRQAVHKLVNEAVQMELVELIDSEEDKRVKLVGFTAKGFAMSASATRNLEKIEQDLAQRIGQADLDELKRILAKAW
ncbi:MarR family winged helix-turn-helix transcriptional regulator [Pseudomonas sp. JH-2]|uniref:MarR family winged helix-turn-helix transcriptional regulator n=1 Tax=Pseudomonas sp. JH-2 TaxID=3114998 RepID=UPI002E267A5B|nr:MarR family winged helix-turn-helix transcriptional regulator [Pseudomonas sp. JH-2]